MFRPIPNEIQTRLDAHEEWTKSAGARGTRLEWIDADLSYLDLSARNLVEAILPGCNFSYSHLRNTDFTYVHVAGSYFTDVDMAGVSFYKGNISGSKFIRVSMPFARLMRTDMWEAEFEDVNLADSDLLKVGLYQCRFVRVNFQRSLWSRVNLHDTFLQEVNLGGIYYLDEVLPTSAYVPINGEIQRLEGEHLREWLQTARDSQSNSLPQEMIERLHHHNRWVRSVERDGSRFQVKDLELNAIDFSGQDLIKVVLTGCTFKGCNFRNTKLYHANLASSHFIDCDFAGADFSHSTLTQSQFIRTTLPFARLWNARFTETEFHHSDLTDVNFYGSHLFQSRFIGCDMRRALLEATGLEETVLQDVKLEEAYYAKRVKANSAMVSVNGELQRLEGEALQAWLLVAVAP
jgi:uncharacterized protein YjbI with pentapeptide repeats